MLKNFIWDFDGTIVDSYPIILKCYEEIIKSHGIDPDMKLMEEILIRLSSKEAKEYIEENYQISIDTFNEEYFKLSRSDEMIKRVTFRETSNIVCEEIKKRGNRNFLITDRDGSTMEMLENLNACDYFEEIVYLGSEGMTKRKPDPEAFNYLIKKYNLKPEETVYIGDRDIDVETSKKVGFKTCLFCPIDGYTSKPDYVIHSFKELLDIE